VRRGVAALAALLCVCGCGGAKEHAQPSIGSAISTSAATYWTASRMEHARAVPILARPGKPAPATAAVPAEGPAKSVAPTPRRGARLRRVASARPRRVYPFPYDRYVWSGPTTSLPARTWGKIFFRSGGYDWVCSGTALASANESVVWTAGHCAARGGRAEFYDSNWIFVPGYDHGTAPYGRFPGRKFFTTKAWFVSGNSAFDLAAVVVGRAKGRTLVDTVGGQGIAFNQPRNQQYLSGGYPADPPFDGSTLYVCQAPFGNVDRGTHPPTTAIGCDLTGGSSGGGWLIGLRNGVGFVDSVNSYGYNREPDAMYGPYQGNAAQRLYERASSWKPR
jgi:hypothetical protein